MNLKLVGKAAKDPKGDYPLYCCKKCGSEIGLIGKLIEAVGKRVHRCGR